MSSALVLVPPGQVEKPVGRATSPRTRFQRVPPRSARLSRLKAGSRPGLAAPQSKLSSIVAKVLPLEDRLAALNELRQDPASPAARKELAKSLASKINLLAAKAARIAGEC